MKKRKLVQLLVAAMLTTVLLTGCGNKQGETMDTLHQTQDVSGSEPGGVKEPARKENEESRTNLKVENQVKEPEVKIKAEDNITAWATKDADLYNGYLEDAQVIGTLTQDTEVVITGVSSDAKYYEIKNGDGLAYVMAGTLTSEKPDTTTASNNTGETAPGNSATTPQADSSIPEQWRNADGTWNYEAMTFMVNGDIALNDEAGEYVFNTNPWTMDQWRAYNAWYDAKMNDIYSQGTY